MTPMQAAVPKSITAQTPLPYRSPCSPSLFAYAPEMLLAFSVALAAQSWGDADLWGHLRFGQQTISHLGLIRHDPYSYSAPGHLWLNHEWLTEVIMALFYNQLGVIGLKLWKLGCAATVVCLLAAGLGQTQAPPRIQLCVLALCALSTAPAMAFRPQLFTFALFAGLLALLAEHRFRGRAHLWLAVPLMALWANLHGGFIVGVAALLIYAAVLIVEAVITASPLAQPTRLATTVLAAIGATFLTPYGWDSWTAVIHAIGNPLTRTMIEDWKSPLMLLTMRPEAFGTSAYIMFGISCLTLVVIVGGVAVCAGLTPEPQDLPQLAIAAAMSGAAFVSMRNMPLAGIACAVPLAHHSSLLGSKIKWKRAAPQRPVFSTPPLRLLIAALALALAAMEVLQPIDISASPPYPSGAVAFMKAHRLTGNLLCGYNWGEYLIWHVGPSSKVSIDGRYDTVYPAAVILDAIAFGSGDSRAAASVLQRYPHDYVLTWPGSRPDAFMEHARGWKLIYRDRDAELFARATSAAAKLPGLPVVGIEPAHRNFP